MTMDYDGQRIEALAKQTGMHLLKKELATHQGYVR
jgi:hypothetical protein